MMSSIERDNVFAAAQQQMKTALSRPSPLPLIKPEALPLLRSAA
jgi:hypothetical protein